MGTSYYGQISYSVNLGDEFEFPWDNDDIDDWWREVNGFKNPIEYPYTEKGELKEGMNKEDTDYYWDKQRKWDKENPIPIHLTYYGGFDNSYPMITAIGIEKSADCWEPTSIDKSNLEVSKEKHDSLVDFCKKYIPDYDEEEDAPKWHLSSWVC